MSDVCLTLYFIVHRILFMNVFLVYFRAIRNKNGSKRSGLFILLVKIIIPTSQANTGLLTRLTNFKHYIKGTNMNTFTKSALSVFAAVTISASAFASNDDNTIERMYTAKAGVQALAKTLENLGETVNTHVDLTDARTFTQKEAVYLAKHKELQAQFDQIKSERS